MLAKQKVRINTACTIHCTLGYMVIENVRTFKYTAILRITNCGSIIINMICVSNRAVFSYLLQEASKLGQAKPYAGSIC